MNRASLTQALATLRQAAAEKGLAMSEEKFIWLLGLVAGESYFGTSPKWTIPNELDSGGRGYEGASNNWGAIRQFGDGKYILHHDYAKDGSLGTYKFIWVPTQLDGARAFLGALLRDDVSNATRTVLTANGSTPHDLAQSMYTRNTDSNVTAPESAYYTGSPPKGVRSEDWTDTDRINAYANMITDKTDEVRKIFGAPFKPDPVTPPSRCSTEASGWWWQLPVLAAIAYQVTKWGRRR